MSNHDDFFGGSVTPSPGPTPVPGAAPSGGFNPHLAATKEYGQFGGAARPPAKTSSALLPVVVGVVVIAVAVVLGLVGYRMVFGGARIELPQTMLGLEKVDPTSAAGQQAQQALDQFKPYSDIDVEGAMYGSNNQMVFALGGEKGSSDSAEIEDFFTGFESGFAGYAPNASLSEVPAGPLGGELRCMESQNLGVCAWIDADTFGAFVVGPAPTDLADTALQIRGSMEK